MRQMLSNADVFQFFLEGIIMMWFARLVPRSISSLEQLTKKFMDCFQVCTVHSNDVMSLSNVDQRSGEILKGFFKRFNAAVIGMSNPREEIVLMTLMNKVHPKSNFDKWHK